MFVPLRRLLKRSPRAGDVRELRGKFRAAMAKDGEQAEADEVLARKLALAAAYGEVSSCATCAKGKPGERGAYAGGDCCSGGALVVFSDEEVAALAQTGTRPSDLEPAHGPARDPGCAFRGPTGCTLEVAHRPAVCVRYACQILQRELHRSGRHDIEQLARELGAALDRFTAARAEREQREAGEALLRSLA